MASRWPPADAGGGVEDDAVKDSASGRLGRGVGVERGNRRAVRGKVSADAMIRQGEVLPVDGDEVDRRVGAVGAGCRCFVVAAALAGCRGLLVRPVAPEMAGMPLERPGRLGEQGGDHKKEAKGRSAHGTKCCQEGITLTRIFRGPVGARVVIRSPKGRSPDAFKNLPIRLTQPSG